MVETPEFALPFDLSLDLPADGEAVVDLTLNSETDDREDLEPSDEIVQIFTMAVNAQMFSDPAGSGRLAHAALLESAFDPGVGTWKYVFKLHAFPPTSLPVLVALLAQTRHAGDAITRVTFRPQRPTLGEANLDQLIRELTTSPVPGPKLPYSVEWAEGVLASRALMLTFEFRTAVNRHVVEGVERALNVWDHLLFLGGFRFEFTENEKFWPRLGRTAHLTPTIVTHALDIFDAPLCALNCVFNCAAAIHDQGYQLARVTLE